MTSCICWLLVLVILSSNKLSKGDVNRDGRKPHGGGSNQIAAANGINGNNYGFFGSFNYHFQHRKPHKAPPSTTNTASTTIRTTTPTTTYPQEHNYSTTIETTTSDLIGMCAIPPGSSSFIHYGNVTCHSQEDCSRSECCRGPNGPGCYDWPTRTPAPGSLCPVGYAQCAVTPPGTTPFSFERNCNSVNYQSVCYDDEYCCAIGPTPLACCVKKLLTSRPRKTQ